MFPRLATLFTVAFVLTSPSLAQGGIADARAAVKGAEADLSDARAYLADLQKGDFAGIYGVGDDGSLRCGETEANAACAPLTDADKAQALSEAQEMIVNAEAELGDAKVAMAKAGDEAPVRTASIEQ